MVGKIRQLEFIFDEEQEKNGEVIDDIYDTAKRVQHDLNMDDWDIRLEYVPEMFDGNTVAEISYSKYREVIITLYEYRPDRLYTDLAHEMSHTIIGKAVDKYRGMNEVYRSIIDSLLEDKVEEATDDLALIVDKLVNGDNDE